MCGSNGLYTSITSSQCSVQLLVNGTVVKSFDVFMSYVTLSTLGNIKISSADNNQIVILSDSDLALLGFADKTSFYAYWNGVKTSCLSSFSTNPPLIITVPSVTLDNGQSTPLNIPAPGIMLGANINIQLATDITSVTGMYITASLISNELLQVIITNEGGEDNSVFPSVNYNIFT